MDSKGNIVQVEELADGKVKVINEEKGTEEIIEKSELEMKYVGLTAEQATFLAAKSRKERRQWLRDNKMLKTKKKLF